MNAQKSSTQSRMMIAGAVLLALLVAKFFWPMLVFDVPLGYDPGFYRYLFVKHAQGFPPFVITDLDPWARGHPLGLFFFTTIFIRAGVPVDWFIGWIWNLTPVLLALSLAWVTAKRWGNTVGVLVLLSALMSIPLFDGFSAMYWKTLASLVWCVWTFHLLEKRSLWAVPFGILTVATHHQTGLLFGLVVLTWVILPLVPFTRSTIVPPLGKRLRDAWWVLSIGAAIAAVGVLWYLPLWQETVMEQIKALLNHDGSAAGSFPEASFYLRTNGILLLLGAYGFWLAAAKERWTLWQISAAWSFLFVALQLFFYRRFFLQLDFFLLPFAALAMRELWLRCRGAEARWGMGVLIVVQLLLMAQTIVTRGPMIDAPTLDSIHRLQATVPADAFVIGLENETTVALRGWLPHHHVGGPGLFEIYWDVRQWEAFLLGTHDERVVLLQSLHTPTIYLFVSQFFRDYYAEYADAFLRDSCFAATEDPLIYRVTCITPLAQ